MDLSFYGAVESVTGSCHLLKFNDKKVLLDCGQFQGSKREDEMNYEQFDFNPAEIDYLILSHSHIDHCGRIPLLVKRGFKGEIICTKPTYDLCQVMLLDSAHIHESEAEWQNRKAQRAGKKMIEPLYTQQDAIDSMRFFKPHLYNQMIDLTEDFIIRFSDAGHILGSSIVEIWIKESIGAVPIKIVFSGDLGTEDRPLLNNPSHIDKADYAIIESTYGNRLHENVTNKMDKLVEIILKTTRRGGNVVIPSFAVGRTQEIIYELNNLYDNDELANEIRSIPVFIDSPLATKTTQIFQINSQVFDEKTRMQLLAGDNPLQFKNLYYIQSPMESKALNDDKSPKIIISASGMCEAGRIKHHLKHNLWRKESSIVFVGYQAENTLGRRIRDGEKQVKIFGEDITVNAEIYDIEGFSGHADKNGLLKWLSTFEKKPKKLFIVHGEKDSKEEFAKAVKEELDIDCIIPQKGEIFELEKDEFSILEQIKMAHTPPKSLQPADKERIDALLNEIEKVKGMFNTALNLTNNTLEDNVNVEAFNRINNNLIDLENAVMNLTIINGK